VAVVSSTRQEPRTGSFPNGMEYVTWGGGTRTCLLVPGGPGTEVPRGSALTMFRRLCRPLTDAGFAVWVVTRRRHMPAGHTIVDMADDYAQVVAEELGGRVDLVVGVSMGGMIGQYLAAAHPDRFGSITLVAAGCEVSEWGKATDARLATALARRDATGVGAAFAAYLLPSDRLRWVRRLLAPAAGRLLMGDGVPPDDVLIEQRAEESFDSRHVLPRIQVPVLLLAGDRDRFFPRDVVVETARLIPRCTLIWYRGRGHLRSAIDRRIASDALAFMGMPTGR